MGKLLSGKYGKPPEAESMTISLVECNQKLSLKPSDFVSEGPPRFFEDDLGAKGRYLLFLTEPADTKGSPGIWKSGYYLLPLESKDVLVALQQRKAEGGRLGEVPSGQPGQHVLPVTWEEEPTGPPEVTAKALEWAKASQPLFFKCSCAKLLMRLNPPWALRTRWKARLRCPDKCQPQITILL